MIFDGMPLKKQLFQIRIGLSVPPKFVKRLIKCWINCQKLQIIEIDTVLLVLYISDGRIISDMLRAMCPGSALRYQLWYPTWEWRNSMRNSLSNAHLLWTLIPFVPCLRSRQVQHILLALQFQVLPFAKNMSSKRYGLSTPTLVKNLAYVAYDLRSLA